MTEEQLQIFENCGAAEMPVAETCQIAEVEEAAFWADEAAQKRYHKGQLQTKFEIRQATIKMAKSGQPQMVKFYLDFVAENAADLPPAVQADEPGGEFDQI